MSTGSEQHEPKSPLREIVQPFIDLMGASRALWGINLGYMLEGLVYFGILGYLSIHFSEHIFKGIPHADDLAHKMVGVLTAGITLSMVFLGGTADKLGARRAMLLAFSLLLAGRFLMSAAPTLFGCQPTGQLWSELHWITMAGIVLVVIGYGMYQPAAYAGVRKISGPHTVGMNMVMLYAVMNLGGWFPTYAFLLRDEDYLNLGIPGVFWVYTGLTALALISTFVLLTPRATRDAIAAAARERAEVEVANRQSGATDTAAESGADSQMETQTSGAAFVPWHMWILAAGVVVALYVSLPAPWSWGFAGGVAAIAILCGVLPQTARWLARHPLADGKFCFFIFALIPVQTLFTYNWFILPAYIKRAYEGWGWIGKYYEIFSNQNPLLVFALAPVVAALTCRNKIYNVMIVGTLVMALPAFLPALGTHPMTLVGYIVIMTIGEVMWQPRFLQYAAQIAPEGQTGRYVGVAQLPWFLTKVLVPLLYSGKMMDRYCPAEGPRDPETMWLIFGFIAIVSPILLIVAKPWVGKSLKTV